MKKFLAFFLCALMVTALAAGCGNNDATPNTPDSPNNSGTPNTAGDPSSTDTPTEKVINYANGAAPEAMDPISSIYAKTSIVMYNIYCGLTRIGKDGVAELAYADSYTVSDDGLVWTFHIREGSKFSDGSDLNAHDFVDSFEYHMRPETNARSIDLKKYVKNSEAYNLGQCEWEDVGFKALDDNTLEITLENPCTYFLDICCTYIPYHMDSINAHTDWAKNPETYITNGAFRVVKIQDQVGFYCEKNPYYYDADNVKIDKLNFIWIDDEAVELASYKNGTVNVSDTLSAESEMTYRGTVDYHSCARIGVKYFTFNTEHIPDARVRKALSYAIDREALIKILGYADVPAYGFVPYGIHWGDKQWRDVADEKNGQSYTGYDPEKAKALLADAGYPNGEGLPTYTFICYNTETDRAQALQAMWKAVGINVEIQSYEGSVYWDVFDTEDWDIGDDGWTGDFDDPNTNLFLWEEYREVRDDGTLKDARWHNDAALQYDKILKETYRETDNEKRMELFREAEKVLLDDMPVMPVLYYNDTILIKPEIQGVVKSYIGHVFFQYADIVQ